MLFISLLIVFLATISENNAYVHDPKFHYTLGDVAGTPEPYPYLINAALHIVYHDTTSSKNYSAVSTDDFATYTEEGRLDFLPDGAILTSIVHDDDNKSGRFTSTGSGNLYVSYIDSLESNFLVSTNGGQNWTKPCAGNCVTGNVGGASVTWDEASQLFYTISADNKVATTADLRTWETGDLYTFTGVEHELFVILPDDDPNSPKWIYLSKPESGLQQYVYYIGTMAGETFAPESGPFVFDYGHDSRDIQIANSGDSLFGKKIVMGCLTSEYYFTDPTIWRDIFYNPRQLALKEIEGEYRLVQRPLKRDPFKSKDYSFRVVNIVADGQNPLAAIRAKSFRLSGEFYAGTSVPLFGIGVLKQGNAQKTTIGFEPFIGDFFLDRIFSGYPPAADTSNYGEYAELYRAPFKKFMIPVKVDVLVDSSTVEIFCNDGEIVFSIVVFPDYYSDEIELFSSVGDTYVENFLLQVYD